MENKIKLLKLLYNNFVVSSCVICQLWTEAHINFVRSNATTQIQYLNARRRRLTRAVYNERLIDPEEDCKALTLPKYSTKAPWVYKHRLLQQSAICHAPVIV